ncbi:MAG: alpha/beta hydrolase [Gemmatimonas sp.]|nr:alpha/beta hydrolase [Gemmatimonas sp.]
MSTLSSPSCWRLMASATLLTWLVPTAPLAQGAAPTPTSLSGNGEEEVATYTDFPDASEFGDATIYYPADVDEPVGGVAIAPGFTERQGHIEWWGPRLASHGYAVLILDTNDPRDRPDVRAEALIAAVRTLKEENSRQGSPLFGKVDTGRMAVMGHSMGGGGALLAADQLGDEIQAAIPFTPWQPDGDFDGITAPTLVIAGSADDIAGVDEHAWPHFQSIPASTPKVYMEVEGGDHFIADTTRGEDLELIGRYGIAWLKLYLDGDDRYRDFIFGEAQEGTTANLSRYVENPE